MGAIRGERTIVGPFDNANLRILFFQLGKQALEIVNLNPKVIQSPGITRAPAIERETDIAVTRNNCCIERAGYAIRRKERITKFPILLLL